MAEFNLYPRFRADDVSADEAADRLATYAESSDAVTVGTGGTAASSDPDVVVPEQFLEVEGVETYAERYGQLSDDPAVYDTSLWGPTAERFPVPVEHYALQQISSPDLYEFYALGDTVTLVIAESQREAEQVQREVPGPALG